MKPNGADLQFGLHKLCDPFCCCPHVASPPFNIPQLVPTRLAGDVLWHGRRRRWLLVNTIPRPGQFNTRRGNCDWIMVNSMASEWLNANALLSISSYKCTYNWHWPMDKREGTSHCKSSVQHIPEIYGGGNLSTPETYIHGVYVIGIDESFGMFLLNAQIQTTIIMIALCGQHCTVYPVKHNIYIFQYWNPIPCFVRVAGAISTHNIVPITNLSPMHNNYNDGPFVVVIIKINILLALMYTTMNIHSSLNAPLIANCQ